MKPLWYLFFPTGKDTTDSHQTSHCSELLRRGQHGKHCTSPNVQETTDTTCFSFRERYLTFVVMPRWWILKAKLPQGKIVSFSSLSYIPLSRHSTADMLPVLLTLNSKLIMDGLFFWDICKVPDVLPVHAGEITVVILISFSLLLATKMLPYRQVWYCVPDGLYIK